MSIVSSYFSTRTRPPAIRINAQISSILDSILAIAVGLGVRVVVDGVSHQDNRLTGTLVGLWEGVVLQHFIKKMPKSYDPYVAYGIRLFLDFLFTESLSRLVLTLLWTGMGVILADVSPAIWKDTGMRRGWRHLRRDLYTLTHSIPTIPWFPRARTVRFSPSRAPSTISSVAQTAPIDEPTAPAPIRLAPPPPTPRKRPVPGAFPGDASETETDIASVAGSRSPASTLSSSPGTAHHRFSSLPQRRRATVETESEVSYDLDEGNVSSSSDSAYTRTPTIHDVDVPTIEDEEEREVVFVNAEKEEETPKQHPMVLPPTPSDSALALHQPREVPDEVQPPVTECPNIPDDEDWENISRREALNTPPPKETPPTPPAKDIEPEFQPQPESSSPKLSPEEEQSSPTEEQEKADEATPPAAPTTTNLDDDLHWGDSSTLAPAPLFGKQNEGNPWSTKPEAETAPAPTSSSIFGNATKSIFGGFGSTPAPKASSAAGSSWGATTKPGSSIWGAKPPPKAESVGSTWEPPAPAAAAPITPVSATSAKAPAWGGGVAKAKTAASKAGSVTGAGGDTKSLKESVKDAFATGTTGDADFGLLDNDRPPSYTTFGAGLGLGGGIGGSGLLDLDFGGGAEDEERRKEEERKVREEKEEKERKAKEEKERIAKEEKEKAKKEKEDKEKKAKEDKEKKAKEEKAKEEKEEKEKEEKEKKAKEKKPASVFGDAGNDTETDKEKKGKGHKKKNSRSSTPVPPAAAAAATTSTATTAAPATITTTEATDAPDTEPLPDNTSDRLKRALELRKEIADLEEGHAELAKQLAAAWAEDVIDLAVKTQLLVDAALKEVQKVKGKADRWYTEG
ncbi:hypothetical protein DXG03_003929, partial [Asterophora parasitica]